MERKACRWSEPHRRSRSYRREWPSFQPDLVIADVRGTPTICPTKVLSQRVSCGVHILKLVCSFCLRSLTQVFFGAFSTVAAQRGYLLKDNLATPGELLTAIELVAKEEGPLLILPWLICWWPSSRSGHSRRWICSPSEHQKSWRPSPRAGPTRRSVMNSSSVIGRSRSTSTPSLPSSVYSTTHHQPTGAGSTDVPEFGSLTFQELP